MSRRAPGDAAARVVVDVASLLVRAHGAATLGELERALAREGLELDVELPPGSGDPTVAAWIAAGAPGARSSLHDPSDHLVAGFEAELATGERLVHHPSPRRSVGPDLFALLFGTGERFGRVTAAHLRVHRKGARRPNHPLPGLPAPPDPTPGERALWDAVAGALGLPSSS